MKITRNRVISWLGVIILLVTAWYLRSVIAYFLVAALLSFIAAPLMNLLEKHLRWKKKPLPRTAYASVCLLIMMTVIFILVRAILPPLLDQASTLGHITPEEFKRSFGPPIADVNRLLTEWGVEGVNLSPDALKQQFLSWIKLHNLQALLGNLLGALSTLSGWIFSVLFITFFFLREKFLFYRLLHVFIPDKHEPAAQRVMRDMNEMLGRYFRSVLLQILVFGLYIFVGLSIFGEEYALTIAVFSGIINLVSYIGPFLGLTFALVFSVSSHLGGDFYQVILPHLLQVSGVYAVAVMLDNFVSYPMIFSNSLKVHPLELFFVVLAGFQLGGLAGMIVAAPVYTMLRIVAKEFFKGFDIVDSITRNV